MEITILEHHVVEGWQFRCAENGLYIWIPKHHNIPQGISWKLRCVENGPEITIPKHNTQPRVNLNLKP